MDRFVLTDAQWAKMEPHCLGKPSDPGRSGNDNRLFVEAVLWVARTGSPWRRLLLRHEPQPSAKVAALLESGAVADRRHHGARDDRPAPRYGHQALTTVVLLRQRFDFGRHGCNALVKPTPVLGQVSDEANHSGRKRASV